MTAKYVPDSTPVTDTLDCLFCRRPISLTEFKIGAIDQCPHCLVQTIVTRGSFAEAAQLVQSLPDDKEQAVEIRGTWRANQPESRERLQLVQWWDPDFPLTAQAAAQVLGFKPQQVTFLARQGRIPGATRQPPKDPRSKRGPWQIPRWAVYQLAAKPISSEVQEEKRR